MSPFLKSKNNLIKLIAGILTAVIAYKFLIGNRKPSVPAQNFEKKPEVTLLTANQYTSDNQTRLLGTVRALNEANIITERAGKITGVSVKLGQTVKVGQVIITLENATEKAAVLQAEGVYEAAKAKAEQDKIGITDAEAAFKAAQNKAQTVYHNTFITIDNNLKNIIDKIFTDINENNLAIRIKAQGKALELIADRKKIANMMNDWSQQINQLPSNTNDADNILNLIKKAKDNTKIFIDFTEKLTLIINHSDNDNRLVEDKNITIYRSKFNAMRSNINNLLINLENTETALKIAKNNLKQSRLRGSQENSTAEAQVKQALGALRMAQANLQKTILKSPIAGTVNSLSAKVGDFAGAFTTLATIANNQTLEIITYISDKEQNYLKVGDEVLIENKYTGTVTQISPALNKQTGKIEVRIITTTDKLKNGDTVHLQKKPTVNSDHLLKKTNQVIKIPLSAVRLTADNSFVFVIDKNKKLQKKKVELGKIYGNSVEITSGLKADEKFISDVRGLIVGTEVVVGP